jgi:phosphoadenosine phosphosulfate reductase
MFLTGDIERLSKEFETKTPQEILKWAIDMFWPQIALSSSFQTQSLPLLHMASQIRRDVLIFFLVRLTFGIRDL